MSVSDFNPADAAAWIARGREPELATRLAAIWAEFPDLPACASVADRQERSRMRATLMKPLYEAGQRQAEAERHAANFALLDGKAASGRINERDLAILQARDRHGYGWQDAHRYADGWYAAHAGWPYARGRASDPYDAGFRDGGGDAADLFDAARRANLAAMRADNLPPAINAPIVARPRPSDWPKPHDLARPTRWSRRLVIVGAEDLAAIMDEVAARPGAEAMTIIVLSAAGFAPASSAAIHDSVTAADAERMVACAAVAKQLRTLLVDAEYDDILVDLQDAALSVLDAVCSVLPLARSQERTRNTVLLRRAYRRIWMDRGHAPHCNLAGGHIRWGKMAAVHARFQASKPFYAKLGDFTAVYAGAAPGRGHLIAVELSNGQPATGYAASDGTPMPVEVRVPSKAKLRKAMAATLRQFAGATRIMGAAS